MGNNTSLMEAYHSKSRERRNSTQATESEVPKFQIQIGSGSPKVAQSFHSPRPKEIPFENNFMDTFPGDHRQIVPTQREASWEHSRQRVSEKLRAIHIGNKEKMRWTAKKEVNTTLYFLINPMSETNVRPIVMAKKRWEAGETQWM